MKPNELATANLQREFCGKRVLVTGGAGMIGSRLCHALVRLGSAVTVIDDLSSGFSWRLPDGLEQFITGSIVEEDVLRHGFRTQPSLVFHLAALFANQNSVDHPEQDLMVNGLGTLRVFEFAERAQVKRVVYTSSSCVSDLGAATTPYQATKFLGEQYASQLRGRVSIATLRLFNVYGPGDVSGLYRSVVPNMIEGALRNDPLRVYGDGQDTRDYTYVDDVVRALLLGASASKPPEKPLDIGTGRETTTLALTNLIRAGCQSQSAIDYQVQRRWDTTRRRCAQVNEAQNTLGWRAQASLTDGLTATIKWHLAHNLELFA